MAFAKKKKTGKKKAPAPMPAKFGKSVADAMAAAPPAKGKPY